MSKGKKIVLAGSLGIIILFLAVYLVACVVRYKIINEQAINNINLENGTTTIFTKGENIWLFDDTYNIIKEQNLSLVIFSDKYIVQIANQDITSKINVSIDINKDKKIEDYYSISVSGNKIAELKINASKFFTDKEYVSLYQITEDKNVLVNNSIKTQDEYSSIELNENINDYILAYVVPEELKVEDMTIDKGIPSKLDIGTEYTNGTVIIECEDKEAIEIDNKLNIIGKKVGDYKLNITTSNISKDIIITIRPTAEKIEVDKSTLNLVIDANTTLVAKVVPSDSVNKDIKWTSTNESIASVDSNGKVVAKAVGNCEIIVSTTSEPIIETKIPIEVKEKPKASDVIQLGANIPGATYVNGILLVNKNHPIPASYAPGLNKTVWQAFMNLKDDAAVAGHDIQLLSGYRSYTTQQNLYNNYVATYGQEEADTFSAKPGTSEHQTGLAMDVGWIDDAYGETASGKWLAENCHKYGFIIRYPKGKEDITGYKYEPWHIRYLGVDIATDVYQSGLCLEEYLGVQ